MTGTLQPCSPFVSYYQNGTWYPSTLTGFMQGWAAPVGPPANPTIPWNFYLITTGRIYTWNTVTQAWQ